VIFEGQSGNVVELGLAILAPRPGPQSQESEKQNQRQQAADDTYVQSDAHG
jgi:hypothetical protein